MNPCNSRLRNEIWQRCRCIGTKIAIISTRPVRPFFARFSMSQIHWFEEFIHASDLNLSNKLKLKLQWKLILSCRSKADGRPLTSSDKAPEADEVAVTWRSVFASKRNGGATLETGHPVRKTSASDFDPANRIGWGSNFDSKVGRLLKFRQWTHMRLRNESHAWQQETNEMIWLFSPNSHVRPSSGDQGEFSVWIVETAEKSSN